MGSHPDSESPQNPKFSYKSEVSRQALPLCCANPMTLSLRRSFPLSVVYHVSGRSDTDLTKEKQVRAKIDKVCNFNPAKNTSNKFRWKTSSLIP